MSDQLTRADLKVLSPEQILKARRSGRLDAILSRPEANVNQVLDVIERDQGRRSASAAGEAEPTGQPADGQLSRENLADMPQRTS
ncbi:hypothetical protein ACWEWX_35775 [Streptomyces asiaticus]